MVILSLVNPDAFFLILAVGAAFSVVFWAIFLENPERSFAEGYETKGSLTEEHEAEAAAGS